MRAERNHKLWIIREYLRDHHVSTEVATLVKDHNEEHAHHNAIVSNAAALEQMLPSYLLLQLHCEVWLPVVSDHPLIFSIWKRHPAAIWALCREGFQEVPVHSGDTVFATGHKATRMLFVM